VRPRRSSSVLVAIVLLAAAAARAEAPLELQDPSSGRTVAVESGDRATHLVFFATWCPQCVGELEQLAEIEARRSGQGYRLIVVGVRTRQSAERLAEFVAAERPPGRLLFDATGQAESRHGVVRLPTHVVLDATGREVARASELAPTIEQALADLLDVRRGAGSGR
jgi:thiol-disulfide isomerase/thioredoxin